MYVIHSRIARSDRWSLTMAPKFVAVVTALGAVAFLAVKAKAGGDGAGAAKPAAEKKPSAKKPDSKKSDADAKAKAEAAAQAEKRAAADAEEANAAKAKADADAKADAEAAKAAADAEAAKAEADSEAAKAEADAEAAKAEADAEAAAAPTPEAPKEPEAKKAPLKNSAFVFVKPAANTEATQALVKHVFSDNKISIKSEGSIGGGTIDAKKLIDQHYYAIASKATLTKPKDLPVPADKFLAKFGVEWQQALDDDLVFNAADACTKFETDADGLNDKWQAAKDAGTMVKFGGGFYCAKVEDIYVFNGFFMTMRAGFVMPDVSIHYFVVEFDETDLSWEKFRGEILGPTDPADAPAGSLRGKILAQYQELGIASKPFTGENGVHASASPLEGLAERMNWLEADVKTDVFGKELLAVGVDEVTIKQWSVDPAVEHAEGKGSCFDLLEDLDADACLAKCLTIKR